MKLEKMLEPFYIGNLKIKNRFAVTAMVTNLCDENGYATERYARYHEEKAKGGYGLIITEDYAVNAHAGGYKHVARIYDKAMIPGHKKMVDAVHSHGAKIFCQMYHAGRQSNSNVNGGAPIYNASKNTCPWNRQMPEELTTDEIHQIVKDFGVTAANAKEAGFDGVEIHAGNGYLIAGFLSFFQNKRTDEYGGCFDNRTRFLHEIYDEVRKNVGDDYPIMVRFSAEEGTAEGRTIAESRMLAKTLEEWGVNAINCSNGVYGSYNNAQVSVSFMPHAWTAHNAAELKKIVKIPVMASNSIDDPLMAETLVETGMCDFVGMSRASLADPHMPEKAMAGKFNQIHYCVRCVQGCTGGITSGPDGVIRCCVNPELGNEYKYTFKDAVPKKKVLVIGGGPGGMNAAIAAARRGHNVTLWEKKDRLGGELLAAIVPPGKGEFTTYLSALNTQLKLYGVNVVLNKEASAQDVLDFNADKVIIATGAKPFIPNIPGIHNEKVVTARDVLLGNKTVEGNIIVAGGGEVGVETAMYLAEGERGHITIVEMLPGIALKTDQTRIIPMKRFLKDHEDNWMVNTKIKEVSDSYVIVENETGLHDLPYDYVVVSMGYRNYNPLLEQLDSIKDKVVCIGDSVRARNAMEAASEGFDAGYNA